MYATFRNSAMLSDFSTITNSEASVGKQVNFYMTADDEQKFVEFVRSDRHVAVFKSVLPTMEVTDLVELPRRGEPFWFSLCFWDKDHCPSPSSTYIKQQGHYCINEIESEVIQFHRCGLDEGRLVRGRIWAEMTGWRREDPATIINKSEAFSAWYERLANWIKRHSTRNDRGEFVLPGAARFAEQGGVMCQAVLARGKAL